MMSLPILKQVKRGLRLHRQKATATGPGVVEDAEDNDNIAGLACDHFRNASGDAAAGLLTDSELRDKMKEVYDDSFGAGDAIHSAAQELLAEITSGNLSDTAIYALGDACEAKGH